METWADRIEGLMERCPTGALPFSRILRDLERDGIAVQGRETWLFQRLRERTHRFKVLPDCLGPWMDWPGPDASESWRLRLGTGCRDPWVVMLNRRSATPLGSGQTLAARMQEALQAWGVELDDGSHTSVARWIEANGEAERALERLLTDPGSWR